MELLKTFIDMLDDNILNKYEKIISKIIYNETNGSDEGKELCLKLYNDKNLWIKNNNYTIKTLAYFVKTYNFNKYQEWHTNIMILIIKEYSNNNSRLEEIIYKYFWLDFIYLSDGLWFFNNHKYILCDQNIKLRIKIKTELIPFLISLEHSNSDIKESILNIINNLKNKTKLGGIINYCLIYFYISGDKLNNNNQIMQFENCVTEIEYIQISNYYFINTRNGLPEDYLTVASPFKYEELKYNNPDLIEAKKYLDTVFRDDFLVNTVLNDFSSFFEKDKRESYSRIWVGKGSNSKSTLLNILQMWLGPLCPKIKMETIEEFPNTAIINPLTSYNILPFKTNFVGKYGEMNEYKCSSYNERKDVNFDQNIPKLANAIFQLAINNFNYYKHKGLTLPKDILSGPVNRHPRIIDYDD